MIGLKCKICDKIIRPHTKKIRIAKNSEEFIRLHNLLTSTKKIIPLKRKDNSINGKGYIAFLHPEDDKGNIFIVEFTDELYQLICCSNECKKEDERLKREKKIERANQNYIIKKLTRLIREKCKDQCVYCASSEKLEVHHIEPFSSGGKAELDNLVFLCIDCHLIISGKSNNRVRKWKFDYTAGNRINPEFIALQKKIVNKLNKYSRTAKNQSDIQ